MFSERDWQWQREWQRREPCFARQARKWSFPGGLGHLLAGSGPRHVLGHVWPSDQLRTWGRRAPAPASKILPSRVLSSSFLTPEALSVHLPPRPPPPPTFTFSWSQGLLQPVTNACFSPKPFPASSLAGLPSPDACVSSTVTPVPTERNSFFSR